MPFPNDRAYSYDINLALSDNGAAYTATGFGQVAGATATVDLQGNQSVTPKQQARTDFVVVADVTAISGTTPTCKMMVLVSNDPTFGSGNVEQAGEIMISTTGSSRDGINMVASTTGRYEIMCSNQVAGVIYEFVRLYLVIGGTTPSFNIDAFVAVLPEM